MVCNNKWRLLSELKIMDNNDHNGLVMNIINGL